MKTIVHFAAILAAGFAMQISATQAANDRLVYSFCSQANCADGAAPVANLIDVNGLLYGTTVMGGQNCTNCGVVFSIDPDTGAETVLHSFDNSSDGFQPLAGLIDVNGTLYGTTSLGGSSDHGTVFSIDPNTGAETLLHSFAGSNDGRYPEAGVIAVKDVLYGTTQSGGTGTCRGAQHGCGTVFAIDLRTGRETILYAFQNNGTDGRLPYASLVAVGDTLYGTTLTGGSGSCAGGVSCGAIFSVNGVTGAEQVLHSFSGYPNDGQTPTAGLTNVKGTLYGTTDQGGAANGGTIFSIDPATGQETVLHSFEPKSGGPRADLTRVGDALYGTTGADVFAFNPATGSYRTLHRFCPHCGDGVATYASVIAVNGTLYGTTVAGGTNHTKQRYCSVYSLAHGCGTVFAIQLH